MIGACRAWQAWSCCSVPFAEKLQQCQQTDVEQVQTCTLTATRQKLHQDGMLFGSKCTPGHLRQLCESVILLKIMKRAPRKRYQVLSPCMPEHHLFRRQGQRSPMVNSSTPDRAGCRLLWEPGLLVRVPVLILPDSPEPLHGTWV